MPSLISYFKNTVDVVLRGGSLHLLPELWAGIRLTVLHSVAEATQLLHRQLFEHLQIPRMKREERWDWAGAAVWHDDVWERAVPESEVNLVQWA